MTMITITELAKAPQLESRRVARDLLDWLHAKDFIIIKVGDAFEPAPAEPVFPTVGESGKIYGNVNPATDFFGITGTRGLTHSED